MWYILSIINGIKKRKILSMLIIIQFIASFSLLLFSIQYFDNLLFINNPKNWVIETKDLYKLNVKMDNGNEINNIDEVYNELKERGYIETVAVFEYDALGYQNELGSKDMKILRVDKNYYKLFKNLVQDGEGFSEEDFEKNEQLSVLVGSIYKDEFKINDTVTLLDGKKYKVKGVISKNKLSIGDRSGMYIDTNKALIVPMEKDVPRVNSMRTTIVKLVPGKSVTEIKNLNLSKDIKIEFVNLNKLIKEDASFEGIEYDIIMSFVGSIFCIIGITLASILSIWIRKREIGIRYAIGESKLSVFLGITIENILICIVGGICALFYYTNWYKENIIMTKESFEITMLTINLGFKMLSVMTLILVIIIALSSFFTFLCTRKLEPKDLIGGLH
jgi:ABC-type antimicrobial peptide transport system permease subunit